MILLKYGITISLPFSKDMREGKNYYAMLYVLTASSDKAARQG